MLTANSIPPRPTAAANAPAVGLDPSELALELEHQAAHAGVPQEQVGARPDDVDIETPLQRPGEQLAQLALRAGAGEILRGAARAHGRQSRQRVAGLGLDHGASP